jgi:predicted O-methyltransferase YrrM
MSGRIEISEQLAHYLDHDMTRDTAIEQRLRAETAALPDAVMQIGSDEGAFLALLVRLLGARRVLEVGAFTGYSALKMAAALPQGGRLVTCDISEPWTAIGKRYWSEARLGDRIELRLGPALDTLGALSRDPGLGSFDLAFIDADKGNVNAYYEACLGLVRSGGLIAIDNVMWSGRVADPTNHEPDTEALRAINLKVRDDARVDACLLAICDGVMLARKK